MGNHTYNVLNNHIHRNLNFTKCLIIAKFKYNYNYKIIYQSVFNNFNLILYAHTSNNEFIQLHQGYALSAVLSPLQIK